MQFVYVLVSSDNDLYLEELWASVFSLRRFHPEDTVRVLSDAPTVKRILERPNLSSLITEVLLVDVPEHYSPKERSRQIKTTVRNIIDDPFLFIDSDTIICESLNGIEQLSYDISAVPDGHLPLAGHAFKKSVYDNVKRIFDEDVTDSAYWFNSGVMYVADNDHTRDFYRRWNENWTYSTFQKGCSQDQPALVKTDKEFGYMIQQMPDIYNCQVALSLKYYADAAIIHFWHMDFIKDQSYSPFLDLSAYREIRNNSGITSYVEDLITHCKSSFVSPTMPIGYNQIIFLFSPAGQAFSQLHQENSMWAKTLDWIAMKIIILSRGIRKIRRLVQIRS